MEGGVFWQFEGVYDVTVMPTVLYLVVYEDSLSTDNVGTFLEGLDPASLG